MSQIIINGQPLYQVDLPEMTLAQWQALPVAERPKEWIRTDGSPSPCLYYENDMMPATYPASRVTHESVSVTADGAKTWATLLGELRSLMDASKVGFNSVLYADGFYFKVSTGSASSALYMNVMNQLNSGAYNLCIKISPNPTYIAWEFKTGGNTMQDNTNSVPTSGSKITLYY
jgi:hypothetical protein